MRVVALFRVSTEKQETEGASLDAQQRTYRALADKSGWATVQEFRGCESATQAASERRVLQQVLACIREQTPDAIYVHEQSRLTRGDELEVALLLREMRERKLKIIVGGVVRDLGSIDERFMVGIQSLVDRAESERIKERMQRGKRERARQGKKASGPAPIGYRNPPPGAPGRGTLQVVPEEAVVVRKLFALAAKGMGEKAVAKTLNELGMQAARGGRWGGSSVRRVLSNPAYIGTAAAHVWVADPGTRTFRRKLGNENAVLKEGAHEAIIDRDTWDAVHGRTSLPRTVRPRMLAGLLYVEGRPYQGDSSRNGVFYRAARGVKGAPWLCAQDTDAAVWDAFASLATSEAFVEKLLAHSSNPAEQALIAQEIEHYTEQIGKLQRRRARLIEMRADGEIDKATFQARDEDAQRSIQGLERELAVLRSKLVASDVRLAERIVKAVQVLLPGCSRLTIDQKRSILRTIVRRVDVGAVQTGASQQRGPKGLLAGSGGPRWAVGSVAFRLALPPAVGPHEPNGGAPAPAAVGGGGRSRDGQLRTTY